MTSAARAPRRDAAENRQALLEAARRTLADQPDATLEQIAAEAGLSRRSVYGHFASRDALIEELAQAGARRIASRLADLTDTDPIRQLALIALRLPGEIGNVRLAQSAVRGPGRPRLAEALAPVRELVLDAVTRGIDHGALRDDIAAPVLARLVEGAALSVLDEIAEHHDVETASVGRLAALTALGVAGLSWREAGTALETIVDTTGQEIR